MVNLYWGEFSYFQSFDSLKYSKNGKIIQQVYEKRPDIFDTIYGERNKIINDIQIEEQNKIIDSSKMYLTYESSRQINEFSYFLYGCSDFNHNLIINLKKGELPLYLVTSFHFESMTSSLKFLCSNNFSSYSDYYCYLEQNYDVKVLDISELDFYNIDNQIFNIVDNKRIIKMV